jgi:hypothetical protein
MSKYRVLLFSEMPVCDLALALSWAMWVARAISPPFANPPELGAMLMLSLPMVSAQDCATRSANLVKVQALTDQWGLYNYQLNKNAHYESLIAKERAKAAAAIAAVQRTASHMHALFLMPLPQT